MGMLAKTAPFGSFTLVGTSEVSAGTGSTSAIITKPSGTANGDYIVMAIVAGSMTTGGTFTGPAGFTERVDPGAVVNCAVYTKVASGEGATWTINFPNGARLAAVVAVFRNATAFGVIGTVSSNQVSPATNITAPSVTVPTNNSLLLAMYFCNGSGRGTDFANPSGFTTVVTDTDGDNPYLAMFSKVVSSGATGTITSVAPSASDKRGVLLSLSP
jgi:hypothetical protein